MVQHCCKLGSSRLILAALFSLFVLLAGSACAWAASEPVPLYLEVHLNGQPTNLIVSFAQFPDQRIATKRSELAELFIKSPPKAKATGEDLVLLDDIPGLSYRYNAANQTIAITAPDTILVSRVFDASRKQGVVDTQSSFGAVLNYGLIASLNSDHSAYNFAFSGASAHLDGRIFSPYGTLDSSGVIGTTASNPSSILRLNTTWSTSDPKTLQTWRAGDMISGGLSWTRPIRIGGLQVQRNFALRPDLITTPLPAVSGSAGVPSTVDVYVNNIKSYSKDISAGPFTINNIPVVSGAGAARVVVRDVTGRQTETSVPFFSSNDQLRKGMFDYSIAAGFSRYNYGALSFDYDRSLVTSASGRYGLNDKVTIEGHIEGKDNLINVGAGTVTQLGNLGTLSLAGSASAYKGEMGGQFYAALEAHLKTVKLHASTRRTFRKYSDLASATNEDFTLNNAFVSSRATAVDRISIGLSSLIGGSNLNVSFIHTEYEEEEDHNIFNTSWSARLNDKISLFASGFYDFSGEKNIGLYAGVTISLGDRGHASVGVAENASGTRVTSSLTKTASHEPGSIGWRLRDFEGETSSRQASLTYHGKKARVKGTVFQNSDQVSGQIYVDGAVVFAGGDVFASNRINDAFAVVDVGAPNVEVRYENRPVGKTDSNGKLLLPRLLSYQRNKITIDPHSLPVNADIPRTKAEVVPADRNGIVVDFNVRTVDNSALVLLKSKDGKAIPAGSNGTLDASGELFMVGYDGQAFIKNLSAENTVTVETLEGTCKAGFSFKPEQNRQVMVEDVICR